MSRLRDSSRADGLISKSPSTPHSVAIIGAGPAGLMAAETLASNGISVTIYDQMPSVGRKFLLAGRGGLNLTHSEDFSRFMSRYGCAEPHLLAAIESFTPSALRAWCETLGQPTFVGTSGRIFPKAMKASPLLRAWLSRLRSQNVEFKLRHRWSGWDENGRVLFDSAEGKAVVEVDATILAMGGGSWPRLGSDGHWVRLISQSGIDVSTLKPSNCGFWARLSEHFLSRFAGHPLKGAGFSFGGESARGEAVITSKGLEGGAIYALSAQLRDCIAASGAATLMVDLRPGVGREELERALSRPRNKQSMTTFLRKTVTLSPVAIGLLHEVAITEGRLLASMSALSLAALIKSVPLRLDGTAPIERAISTAGGVSFAEIDSRFMLRKKPGVFVAGEMLDWEAPTGGYLLQACFATGAAAARGAIEWLNESHCENEPTSDAQLLSI